MNGIRSQRKGSGDGRTLLEGSLRIEACRDEEVDRASGPCGRPRWRELSDDCARLATRSGLDLSDRKPCIQDLLDGSSQRQMKHLGDQDSRGRCARNPARARPGAATEDVSETERACADQGNDHDCNDPAAHLPAPRRLSREGTTLLHIRSFRTKSNPARMSVPSRSTVRLLTYRTPDSEKYPAHYPRCVSLGEPHRRQREGVPVRLRVIRRARDMTKRAKRADSSICQDPLP